MEKAISWAKAYLSGDVTGAASELCLAAMVAGAGGDGIAQEERAFLLDTSAQLPGLLELPGSQREVIVDRAIEAVRGAEIRATLQTLADGCNAEQRRAAYALACLAALADGVATDAELDHLVEVREGIGLSDGEAADIEATVREGVGARDSFDEEGIAWRLAAPEVRERAAVWATEEIDPTPLAAYADACIEAMVLVAAADGQLDGVEAEHLFELSSRLPVLGGISPEELTRFVADAAGRIGREGADRRLEALAAWLPQPARRGAYILATVIALADQRATNEELLLLDRMRQKFKLPEAEADEILDTVREQVYG